MGPFYKIFPSGKSLSAKETMRLERISGETVSVFESMRSYEGVLFRLGSHLERLFASARTAGLTIPAREKELAAFLYETLDESGKKDAFLRLTCHPDETFAMVTVRNYPEEIFKKGVSLSTSPVRKNLSKSFFPETKTSCYLSQRLAGQELAPGQFEALFLSSEEGVIRETRASNIFYVKKKCLFTPPGVGILQGVTHDVVLEIARENRIEYRETFFTRHDLFNADEVFLTNTSGELIPVREIDGRLIGRRTPDTMTTFLKKQFHLKVRQYLSQHQRKERKRRVEG